MNRHVFCKDNSENNLDYCGFLVPQTLEVKIVIETSNKKKVFVV